MKRIKMIISFDYELFFGDKSGSVQKSLVDPTNCILDCMDSLNVKGNFFIDYLMLKRYEEIEDTIAKRDLEIIKNQIRDIVGRGHRIELHLHPHWIDAKYNNDGTWDFGDFSHYMLSTLSESDVCKLFEEGVSYLNNLAHEIDDSYSICAFRAGGWAVQPFSILKTGLLKSGIKIDSSTSIGLYFPKPDQWYDFRNMPNKDIYSFENDVCIEDKKGSFIEIPISSYRQNIFYRLNDSIIFRLHMADRQTDGVHSRKKDPLKVDNKISLYSKIFRTRRKMFGFSQASPINIIISMLFFRKNICCFIDHPKDYSKLSLSNIRIASWFGESMTYFDLLREDTIKSKL